MDIIYINMGCIESMSQKFLQRFLSLNHRGESFNLLRIILCFNGNLENIIVLLVNDQILYFDFVKFVKVGWIEDFFLHLLNFSFAYHHFIFPLILL